MLTFVLSSSCRKSSLVVCVLADWRVCGVVGMVGVEGSECLRGGGGGSTGRGHLAGDRVKRTARE